MKKLLVALTIGFVALFGSDRASAAVSDAPNFKQVMSDLIAPNTENLTVEEQRSLVAALESYELGMVGRINSIDTETGMPLVTLVNNSQYLIDRSDRTTVGSYVYIVFDNDDLYLQIELDYIPETHFADMDHHVFVSTVNTHYGVLTEWYDGDGASYVVAYLEDGTEYLLDYESGMLLGDYVQITYKGDELYSQRYVDDLPMSAAFKLNKLQGV